MILRDQIHTLISPNGHVHLRGPREYDGALLDRTLCGRDARNGWHYNPTTRGDDAIAMSTCDRCAATAARMLARAATGVREVTP